LWKKVTPSSGVNVKTYYYLRDAQGNVMANYQHYTEEEEILFVATEHPIYGSSRIGVENRIDTLYKDGNYNPAWYNNDKCVRNLGLKSIELSNHLGNVLVTISDKKVYTLVSTNIVFEPEITTITDYYPFGSAMNTRSYSSGAYRYGFNGKELDKNEEGMGGGGSTYDYGFRIYNPALGKFLSVDPLSASYPWYTPYQFAGNIPIVAIDIDGLESKIIIQETQTDGTVKLVNTSEYSTKKVTVTAGYGAVASIDVNNKGPLGAGTYTITKNTDGTFTETWVPDEGNPVDAFTQNNVDGTRWTDNTKTDAKEMYMNRLQGRLVEAMAEDMVYNEQLKKISNPTQEQKIELSNQVKNDITVLETDNVGLKGKFATFINKEVAAKYTKNWKKKNKDIAASSADKASGHKSNYEYTGPEYCNSNYCPKYYDGDYSSTDDVGMQIGIVKEGWFDHGLEAFDVVVKENSGQKTNLGAGNAAAVKNYIEESNKPKP
jgi:RHS repeat-associated protein